MQRAQYTDLFESRLAYIDEILWENYDAPAPTYSQVFNMRTSDRGYEEITGVTGFGLFSEMPEGQAVTYDALMQAYDTRFTHKRYGLGYQHTYFVNEDDLDNIISDAAPALGRSARSSIETEAFSDFNGAFDTITTPDGLYLCDTDHILIGGGLADNLVTGDISQSTLEDALNLFADMRDERNLIVDADASILLIPPELRWVTHELLKSQLRSDTANNASNALNQLGLNVIVSKYLTDADAWFLMCNPKLHRLIFYWRHQPMSDHTIDFDTDNFKTKMTFAFSHGAADWRGIIGSQGA